MTGLFFRLLFPVLFLAMSVAAARAADVAFPALADPVPGAKDVTYLDLARLVLPDLEAAEGAYRGGEVADTRHIGGAEMLGSPPEELVIYELAALTLRASGSDRLALLFDLGQSVDAAEGFALLALYDVGRTPALLDAVQIGLDRHTHFRSPGSVALSGDDDLVLTMSSHFNSSQAYVTSAMLMVRSDRFQLVDTVFTFDDQGCGFERAQMPEFSADGAGGDVYSDIVVTVVETTRRTGDDCGSQEVPPEGGRTVSVTYGWDDARARFVPDSDSLEILARENESRF